MPRINPLHRTQTHPLRPRVGLEQAINHGRVYHSEPPLHKFYPTLDPNGDLQSGLAGPLGV
jgi:hypothetical protein